MMRNRMCRFLSGRRSLGAAAVLFVVAIGYVPATCFAQLAYSWNTTDGNWSNPGNWLPNGVPGNNDGAFIGNLAVAEDATVTLNQNDTVSGVQISNGMTLRTAGNTLTVLGDTTVSGESTSLVSRLFVNRGAGSDDYDTDNLSVSDGARVGLFSGGILEVDEKLTIGSGSSVYGDGVIRLVGTGEVLENNGHLNPFEMIIDVLGGGQLDLDGSIGNVLVGGPGSLTINGGTLTDSFSGRLSFQEGESVAMNLDAPWVSDSNSTIRISGNSGNTDPAVLSGADVTIGGELRTTGFDTYGRIESNVTFTSTASVFLNDLSGSVDRLQLTGSTVVQGGTFTIGDNGTIEFEGPTTIQGGNFISLTDFPALDTSVRLEGETVYRGDVTFTGNTRQIGNATVAEATIINAEVFDMNGTTPGSTTWTINAPATINVEKVEGGVSSNPPFQGVFTVGGSLLSRLELNLSDPTRAWGMDGTMNLNGNVAFFLTRLAGSPVNVTGTLNASSRLNIAADAKFADSSTIDFANTTTILRMSGRTTVESAATLTGDGILENGIGGAMSLAAGLSTGQVGVTNRGRLELGEAVGVVSVDRFEQFEDATLVVDVGKNNIGTDSDVLTIGSGAADLAGFLMPNIVNIGGVFEAPQVGDSFTILTAVGGVNGTFDDVLDSNLGGMIYEWDAIYNPANVVIEVASIGGITGDDNGDGFVNMADYVVWRNTLGSTTILVADGSMNGIIDQADYDVWVANFGATPASGAGDAAVPEPDTLAIMLALGMVFASRSLLGRSYLP